MDDSEKASLEDELSALREKYVNCNSCPPERNCCIFKDLYSLELKKRQLHVLFDPESIEQLLEDEKLFLVGHGTYELRDTRCPALDCDSRCRLYERREEAGLDACIEFPLYAIGEENFHRYSLQMVVADYRCHSMEEHWDELSPALRELAERLNVIVYVRYFTEEEYGGDLPLGEFEMCRDAGGVIPPQKIG